MKPSICTQRNTKKISKLLCTMTTKTSQKVGWVGKEMSTFTFPFLFDLAFCSFTPFHSVITGGKFQTFSFLDYCFNYSYL